MPSDLIIVIWSWAGLYLLSVGLAVAEAARRARQENHHDDQS